MFNLPSLGHQLIFHLSVDYKSIELFGLYRCLPSLWCQVVTTSECKSGKHRFGRQPHWCLQAWLSQARSYADPRNDDLKLFVPTITLLVACHGKPLTMHGNMQATFRAQRHLSIEHSMVQNEEFKLIGRWSWKSTPVKHLLKTICIMQWHWWCLSTSRW